MSLNAKQILKALEGLHGRHEWVFFENFRAAAGAGFGSSAQTLDAYAVGTAKGVEFARIAYEVKVSRSDFFREIKDPEKRRIAMFNSNMFYFVTPKGLVQISELPIDAGLYEVWEGENGRLTCEEVRTALWREIEPPNLRFMASLCRRIRTEEESQEKVSQAHLLHEVAAYAKEVDRLGLLDKGDVMHQYRVHDAYATETVARLKTALKRADSQIERVR